MMVAQMRLDGMLYVHCLSCGALDMDELGHNRGYYGVRGGGGVAQLRNKPDTLNMLRATVMFLQRHGDIP